MLAIAPAKTVRCSGSTADPVPGTGTVAAPSAPTRYRNRDGSTCSSLASARTEDSSIPEIACPAALRRPTAIATASSSSSSSGGIAVPATSR